MRSLAVALLCVVGCYSPSYKDCDLTCAGGICPAGLECRDNLCRLPGLTGACLVEQTDDASTDGPPGPIPLDMFRDALFSAMCKQAVRCGQWENEAVCLETLRTYQQPWYIANLVASVEAGKVDYDADQARVCLDAFAQQSCTRASLFLPTSQTPAPCEFVLKGTIGNGGTCAMADQCISKVCSIPSCTEACCTGTCMGDTAPAQRMVNESCTLRDRCLDSYCDGAICVAYKTVGAVCTAPHQCGPGATCKSTPAGQMTCQALSMTLGACTTTQDCLLLSDVCSAGKCVTGGLSGFSCPMGNECQQQHWCKNMMCAVPPTIGESCMSFSCRSAYCLNGQCEAKKADNEACDPLLNGQDCQSAYCNMTQARCETRPTCI